MTDILDPIPAGTMIERLFRSLSKHGVEKSLADLVHPDATFIGVREERHEAVPIYGSYHGHKDIPHFFETLKRLFDTQAFDIHHALEEGDISMASGSFHHIVKETTRDFKSHWACLCTLQDGKIRTYRFYEDTAALEAAMGVTTSP